MAWHHVGGESQARLEAEAIWRRFGLAWCLWLALSTPALGQALEIGGSIGTAARGAEGALVRPPWYPSPGIYANVAWTQRLETTIRVVWVQLGSRQGTSGYFNGCESGRQGCRPAVAYYIVERSKAPWMVVTGSAHYYFRPREVVRPFVGLGVGVSRNSMHVTCQAASASCDNVASAFRLGRRVSLQRDTVAIAGVAATFKRNYIGRATVNFHRPGGESSSLFETALTLGYRF